MYLFFPDYICRQKIRGDSQGMPHSQFGRQRVFPLYSYLLFETDISSPYIWHFVTGHFVIRTFHRKDILSHGHLVTRTFCHTDISSHNLLVSLQITKKNRNFLTLLIHMNPSHYRQYTVFFVRILFIRIPKLKIGKFLRKS